MRTGASSEGGERAGTRHLVDLPKGYHAAAGGHAWHEQVPSSGRLPSGRRVIGLHQVDEMALGPAVWSGWDGSRSLAIRASPERGGDGGRAPSPISLSPGEAAARVPGDPPDEWRTGHSG